METNYAAFYEAYSALLKEKLNINLETAIGINRVVCIDPEESSPSSLGPKFSAWISSGADNETRGKDILEMLQGGIFMFGYANGSRKPVTIELDENEQPVIGTVNFEVGGKPSGLKNLLYVISLHMLFREEVEGYKDKVIINGIVKDQLMDFQHIALPQVELQESIAEPAE